MDMDLVTTFITTVGFPVFVGLSMMHQNKLTSENYIKLYHELKNSIDKNTKVIESLMDELKS